MTFDNLVSLASNYFTEAKRPPTNYEKTNPHAALNYAKTIVNDRWPEAENIIKTDPYSILVYARDVVKDRWPEAEDILLSSKNANLLTQYAVNVVKGRWPEAEAIILNTPAAKEEYKEFLSEIGYDELEETHRSGKRLA
jgi:hypothetical protein